MRYINPRFTYLLTYLNDLIRKLDRTGSTDDNYSASGSPRFSQSHRNTKIVFATYYSLQEAQLSPRDRAMSRIN